MLARMFNHAVDLGRGDAFEVAFAIFPLSASNSATSFQSRASSASRIWLAMVVIWSKFLRHARSLSMCAFMTSQLLMAELRGWPV